MQTGHVLVKFTAADTNRSASAGATCCWPNTWRWPCWASPPPFVDFAASAFWKCHASTASARWARWGYSLRALDAEFVGAAHAPWPVVVQRLVAAGHVTPQSHAGAALLWAFGTLIGNTDMHAGNLSFISLHGRPYQLAPATTCCPWALPRAAVARW
jgi:hypothetical protein